MKSFKQHQQHKAKKAARRSAKETIKTHVRAGDEKDSAEVANLKYVPADAEHKHEPAHHDEWLASDHCW